MKKFLLLLTCAGVLFGCGGKKDDGAKTSSVSFKEPILSFGASKSTIRNMEPKAVDYEEVNGLMYDYTEYVTIYAFLEDKLTVSGVVFPPATDKNSISTFLSSKYKYLGKDNDYIYWETINKLTMIGLKKDILGYYILYVPKAYGAPTLKSNESGIFDEALSAINKQLK